MTNFDKLRRFFRPREDHHRLCMTNAPGPVRRECNCYASEDQKAHALIDKIEAENAKLWTALGIKGAAS